MPGVGPPPLSSTLARSELSAASSLPEELRQLIDNLPDGFVLPVVLPAAALAGVLAHAVLRLVLRRALRIERSAAVLRPLLRHTNAPMLFLLPLVFLQIALHWLELGDYREQIIGVSRVAIILTATWLLVRSLLVVEEVALAQLNLSAADNLGARKIQTQLKVMRRVGMAVIVVFGLIAVLLTFERFRELGAGLLASAGIISIVLGLAAQRTLGNLFAGLQLGMTQPIRLDDVLVVEGEWGRVEEITLTYVVVRIWDLRRLVLPISYFLEKPFQNWTRVSSDILGTVFLRVDYGVDIDALRGELQRVVSESELWDGEVCKLQVTDAGEKTLELRALVSAASSGDAWELRCEVRERLVKFLQREQPDALPVHRALMRVESAGPESDQVESSEGELDGGDSRAG